MTITTVSIVITLLLFTTLINHLFHSWFNITKIFDNKVAVVVLYILTMLIFLSIVAGLFI